MDVWVHALLYPMTVLVSVAPITTEDSEDGLHRVGPVPYWLKHKGKLQHSRDLHLAWIAQWS